jgi:hypothetical protein
MAFLDKVSETHETMEFLRGYKAGIDVLPIPHTASEPFRAGYRDGRSVLFASYNNWATVNNRPVLSQTEILNILIRVK